MRTATSCSVTWSNTVSEGADLGEMGGRGAFAVERLMPAILFWKWDARSSTLRFFVWTSNGGFIMSFTTRQSPRGFVRCDSTVFNQNSLNLRWNVGYAAEGRTGSSMLNALSLECNKTWGFRAKKCPYVDFSWWWSGRGGTWRTPASTHCGRVSRGTAFPRQKRKGNAVPPRSPTIWPLDLEWLLLLKFMCKYCIFTMDLLTTTSTISYVHIIGQYYYYYYYQR